MNFSINFQASVLVKVHRGFYLLSRRFIARRSSLKMLYEHEPFKYSQNSQENNYARASSLIKMKTGGPQHFLQNRLQHRCLFVNFLMFLRTPFSKDSCFFVPINNSKGIFLNISTTTFMLQCS